MAQRSVPVSTRQTCCFDTVWRQRGRAGRPKQASLIFSNSSRNLRWGKCDSGGMGQLQYLVIRGRVGAGGVGGYWSNRGHLWHLSGDLSVVRERKWGYSGVVLRACVWYRGQTTIARQTGSLKVHPVSPHVWHKQLVFVSLGPLSVYFSFSLCAGLSRLLPLATQNTER